MHFISKTISRKIIFASSIAVAVLLAISAILYLLDPVEIKIYILAILAAALIIITSAISIVTLARPLYKITREMKAMMIGKTYKKIFSTRIDELGVISNFFNEISSSLEKATAEIKERRRLANELNTAAQIQNDLLPKEKPKIPGLDITAKTRAAAEIGGDSYDFITQKNNSIIYLGDVTGHGIPAGLVMMMANTLVHSFASFELPANEILIKTNKELKPRIKKAMFMTMVLLSWNHKTKSMIFSGAGHEYLIIYRAKTGEAEKIPSGGIALGMIPDNTALTKNNDLKLDIGDVIVLYSDGLTEGRSAAGEMYTEAKVIENLLEVAKDKNSDEILSHIAQKFSDFSENVEQADDVSMMVIKRVEE